jgi:hypothetical protein
MDWDCPEDGPTKSMRNVSNGKRAEMAKNEVKKMLPINSFNNI